VSTNLVYWRLSTLGFSVEEGETNIGKCGGMERVVCSDLRLRCRKLRKEIDAILDIALRAGEGRKRT
jgi:hypothetical protein